MVAYSDLFARSTRKPGAPGRVRPVTIRVGVFGAGGRMGSTVCRAVADDPDLELVAGVDPLHVGIDLRQVTGADVSGLQMSPDADALLEAGATVAVDFTHVDAARANIEWCAANGVHAVVGTTGFADEDSRAPGSACSPPATASSPPTSPSAPSS